MSTLVNLARPPARLAVRGLVSQLLFAALASMLYPTAQASDVQLTLEAAQQHAVVASRNLAAKEHAAQASREMAVSARQLPDPVLSVAIDNLPVDGPDRYSLTRDFMTQRRVGLSQELTRGDKRRLRAERYERQAARSEEEKQAVIAEIQRDTAIAWLERYYAEAMAQVLAEQAQEARLEIEGAEAAYRGGRGSQADVYAARSVLATVEDRVSDIKRRVAAARIMLARWTRDNPDTALGGRPDIDRVSLVPADLDGQLLHHPQNRVLMREQELAATEANLARADKKADWSVELAYQQRGAAYSNMVSIGLSVPLQWNQNRRQDRELASKLAAVEQVRAEADEALREHVTEARLLLDEWESKRERAGRYHRELLPLAQARTQAALGAYRGGKGGLADVLAARRGEIETRLQALQLEAETARLWAQLNFLAPAGATAAPDTPASGSGQ